MIMNPMVQEIKLFLGAHLEEFANLTPYIQQN